MNKETNLKEKSYSSNLKETIEGLNGITLIGIGRVQLPPVLILGKMEPNILLISDNDHCFMSLNNDTCSYPVLLCEYPVVLLRR